MYPVAESEAKVFYRNHHLLLTIVYMTVFIRGAPVEDNTASECIRTVATMYGRKTLQFSICTNMKRMSKEDMKRSANDTPRIPVHAS